MASELVNAAADGNYTHVPYRGGAPLVLALLTSEVRWGLLGTADARAQIQAGKLKALGQLRATRSELWPDLPTLTEQGLRGGVDFDMWFGLVAPAKTPPDILKKMNEALNKVLSSPEVAARLQAQGISVIGGTGESARVFMEKQMDIWAKVVKDNNIKAD